MRSSPTRFGLKPGIRQVSTVIESPRLLRQSAPPKAPELLLPAINPREKVFWGWGGAGGRGPLRGKRGVQNAPEAERKNEGDGESCVEPDGPGVPQPRYKETAATGRQVRRMRRFVAAMSQIDSSQQEKTT